MKLPKKSIYDFFGVGPGKYTYVSPNSFRPIGDLGECLRENSVKIGCPNLGITHGADTSPQLETRSFYLASKSKGDFMWYPGICLFDVKHEKRIAAGSFSGIEFRDPELYTNESCTQAINGYRELRVTGRVPIDCVRSGVSVEYTCPLCGAERYGHWDQSKGLHFVGDYADWPDLFLMSPPVTQFLLVKARFAQLVIDLKLKPVMLTRIEDIRLVS